MKFSAPKIEEIPAKCKLKIAKSTAGPGEPKFAESGGYIVQPPPTPGPPDVPSTKSDAIKSTMSCYFPFVVLKIGTTSQRQ